MNKQRYSKKFDFYYYEKEYDLFKRFKKRVENNTHIKENYLSDMKVFIELIRTLDNYNEWLETNQIYKLIINNEKLFFISKTTSKYGDFQFHNKERQLFYYTKKRVEQTDFSIKEEYLSDMKVFIELIRTLENYDEWLSSCGSYNLESCNDELLFCLKASKPCAKINRYTKKVTYFTSVGELSEDVGYCETSVWTTMNTLNHRDGFYYCHADKVEEILQQL